MHTYLKLLYLPVEYLVLCGDYILNLTFFLPQSVLSDTAITQIAFL